MYNTYANFGYAILKAYSKKHNFVAEAVDFMVKHTSKANLDCISRAMQILKSGPRTPLEPEQQKLWNGITESFNEHFKQDMIYYTINYDGFRL